MDSGPRLRKAVVEANRGVRDSDTPAAPAPALEARWWEKRIQIPGYFYGCTWGEAITDPLVLVVAVLVLVVAPNLMVLWSFLRHLETWDDLGPVLLGVFMISPLCLLVSILPIFCCWSICSELPKVEAQTSPSVSGGRPQNNGPSAGSSKDLLSVVRQHQGSPPARVTISVG